MTCTVRSRTAENTVVDVVIEIIYKVIPSQVHVAYYSMSDPRGQITSYCESSLRAQLPKHSMDNLFAMKSEIADCAKLELHSILTRYGYEVVDLLLVDIRPPPDVLSAMQRAVEERYGRMVARTKGEITRLEQIKKAEASAEETRLRGFGAAEMQKAVTSGVTAVATTLDEATTTEQKQEVLAMMLMQQYLDALDTVAKAADTEVIFTNQTGLLTCRKRGEHQSLAVPAAAPRKIQQPALKPPKKVAAAPIPNVTVPQQTPETFDDL